MPTGGSEKNDKKRAAKMKTTTIIKATTREKTGMGGILVI